MAHCGNIHGRHWFSLYGHPGIRSPKCVRCGAPNPRPLTESELREYDYVINHIKEYGY